MPSTGVITLGGNGIQKKTREKRSEKGDSRIVDLDRLKRTLGPKARTKTSIARECLLTIEDRGQLLARFPASGTGG